MDALVALTARPVTLSYKAPGTTVVSDFRQVPAGTPLYVGAIRRGVARVRLPGTLFSQRVAMSSLVIP